MVDSNKSLGQRMRERIKLDSQQQQTEPDGDSLLFIGNWHDATPRALVLDPLLQSTDKCVYLLLRTYISAKGRTRMPSYDDIARLLNISRGTVAKSLHILRATRWITLCNALRDDETGRFKGNIYAIHDEVLSISEACQLDGKYIETLEQLEASHNHDRVKTIAYVILENIRRQLHESEISLSSPYQESKIIARFLNSSKTGITYEDVLVQNLDADHIQVQKSDSGKNPVQFLDSVTNKTENHALKDQVQNLDVDAQKLNSVSLNSSSSYINNFNKKTTTTSPDPNRKVSNNSTSNFDPINPELVWPSSMNADERWIAWQALKKCPEELQQNLLDEMSARMQPSYKNIIKNPSAWLAWAVKQLKEGEIYPITNLALKYQKLREREQKQKLDLEQSKMNQPSTQTSGNAAKKSDYKSHVTEMKLSLRGVKSEKN